MAGSVVLDAKGARRVIYVAATGRAELIGLNITGGATNGREERGGGLFIEGTATLTNTNVYKNQAYVCSPVESSLSSRPAPRWNVACAHGWQYGEYGGGLFIRGMATLTDTNVYENRANVCSPIEPSLSAHPAPRSNVTCAHGWQWGGGLYIVGTATLTDTNVNENRAEEVRAC